MIERTEHVLNDHTVEFSREAMDSFCRHSYVARVTRPNGDAVIVSLPKGAARLNEAHWVTFAVNASEGAKPGSVVST